MIPRIELDLEDDQSSQGSGARLTPMERLRNVRAQGVWRPRQTLTPTRIESPEQVVVDPSNQIESPKRTEKIIGRPPGPPGTFPPPNYVYSPIPNLSDFKAKEKPDRVYDLEHDHNHDEGQRPENRRKESQPLTTGTPESPATSHQELEEYFCDRSDCSHFRGSQCSCSDANHSHHEN